MRELNRWQNMLFLTGGLLMVAGAGVSLLEWGSAPYIYTIGALAFTSMQFLHRYDGSSITLRRLRSILILSDLLFLATAVLMFASIDNAFGLPQIFYVQYIYRKWVGTLLLAAVIQVYAVHRIDYEAKKR